MKFLKTLLKLPRIEERQIEYQGQRILAWQQEKHFEREAEHTSPVDQVTVIRQVQS
jgi:hypothetical protein